MDTLQSTRALQAQVLVVMTFAHFVQVMSPKLNSMARTSQDYDQIQQRTAGGSLMQATIQHAVSGNSGMSDVSTTDSVSLNEGGISCERNTFWPSKTRTYSLEHGRPRVSSTYPLLVVFYF